VDGWVEYENRLGWGKVVAGSSFGVVTGKLVQVQNAAPTIIALCWPQAFSKPLYPRRCMSTLSKASTILHFTKNIL
jgi:hypothetical protein